MSDTPRLQVIRPISVLEGAGVRLHRSFPQPAVDHVDPFLLLDDFSSTDPDDFMRGFPWHPHRGIETVTYVLQGEVRHRDSIGNAGSIRAGEVQWMTAGSGIMHEEMPAADRAPLVGFQLWVNLPARQKLSVPRYQSISAQEIPQVALEGGGNARVIAGEIAGVRGPVTGITIEPTYLDVQLEPGGSASQAFPPGTAMLAYVFEGTTTFSAGDHDEAATLDAPGLVAWSGGGQIGCRAAARGARFLLISGMPLYEPVARYGPFVMNTREEIEEALRDLRQGTFIRAKPAGAPDTTHGK